MANDEENTITVFIVAPSLIARAGLESVLRDESDFTITGSAAELPIDFFIEQSADVMLVGIEREKDFTDLQVFIGDHSPEIGIPVAVALFPAEMQNPKYASLAIKSGVRGILPREAAAREIVAAIAAAASDLITMPPEIADSLLTFHAENTPLNSETDGEENDYSSEPVENLTPRETQILELLADGASNKEIAYKLNISEHTVKFHVASVFGKFGVNTRTEAVTYGLRRGLILL